MMNRPQLHLKRIVYNSKLNREKFIINKKKMNERKFCTYQPKNQDPESDPDLSMMFLAAMSAYVVGKINENKKR